MNVNIESVKFTADVKLIDYIEKKVSKLERLLNNIVSADVTLKMDKDNDNGNKIVILKIDVPGHDLLSERRSHTFEEAVDNAVDAIKKQIDKYKDR